MLSTTNVRIIRKFVRFAIRSLGRTRCRFSPRTHGSAHISSASAGIGFGPLSPYRKSPDMAKSPVSSRFSQVLDIQHDFPAKIPFNFVTFFHYFPDTVDFLLGKFSGSFVRIYLGQPDNFSGGRQTNPVNIRKCIFNLFVVWNIYTCDTHIFIFIPVSVYVWVLGK